MSSKLEFFSSFFNSEFIRNFGVKSSVKKKSVMYRFKNPKVEIDRTLYEIVWITEFAEHISSNFYDRDDTARHLNFGQIQDLILNNDRYEFWKPNMIKFFKKLPDGKDYVVIALIKVKRVVPKSGRIDNFKNNRIGVRI